MNTDRIYEGAVLLISDDKVRARSVKMLETLEVARLKK